MEISLSRRVQRFMFSGRKLIQEQGLEVKADHIRYQAKLPDELDLSPGMKIRVLRLYDDSWGTGQVVNDDGEVGKQGAFPIVCGVPYLKSAFWR